MTRLAFQKDHFGPSVEQGPANYGLWDKSGPPPVFVNKVLLEHSQAHSSVYCLRCFPIAVAVMETIGPTGPNIFTTWPFIEKKNSDPWYGGKGK